MLEGEGILSRDDNVASTARSHAAAVIACRSSIGLPKSGRAGDNTVVLKSIKFQFHY